MTPFLRFFMHAHARFTVLFLTCFTLMTVVWCIFQGLGIKRSSFGTAELRTRCTLKRCLRGSLRWMWRRSWWWLRAPIKKYDHCFFLIQTVTKRSRFIFVWLSFCFTPASARVCVFTSWFCLSFFFSCWSLQACSYDVHTCVHMLANYARYDEQVYIFQLDGSVKPFRAVDTVLKMQTRCISAWPTKDGFCVGSIEGQEQTCASCLCPSCILFAGCYFFFFWLSLSLSLSRCFFWNRFKKVSAFIESRGAAVLYISY